MIPADSVPSTEAEQRIALAAAYRLVAREGLDDGIWNHLSAAVPGEPGHFLLKPHGLFFEEVRASHLIVIDIDGALIRGDGAWEPTAFYIHSRLHHARPDLACVMHAHMPFAGALVATEPGRLLPLTQDSLRFYERIGYYENYSGLALDAQEGDAMVAALGSHDLLLMANHGVLVGAATIADAFYQLRYLEQAARYQALALGAAIGGSLRPVTEAIARRSCAQLNRHRPADAALHFAAARRMLDREGQDYAS